jgi:V/A-type H+-transporting ATPase subunit E
MSIENILIRIDEETRSRVDEIVGAAEAKAATIRGEYEKGGAALREELAALVRARAENEERRLVVAAKLELRKQLLERKREILAEVYGEARSRIEALPAERYLEILKALVLGTALSGREEIVVPAAQRALFTPAFVEALNREREGASMRIADEPGDFAWGVVLREGRRRVDLTIGVIFEQLASRIESRVAAALFPE